GVEQRDALRGKAQGARPHVLVMTATPIPRTVAMTVYGDLDVSTLAELPRGRSAIATHVVPAAEKPRYLERAWERVREEAEEGAAGVRGLPAPRRGGGRAGFCRIGRCPRGPGGPRPRARGARRGRQPRPPAARRTGRGARAGAGAAGRAAAAGHARAAADRRQ